MNTNISTLYIIPYMESEESAVPFYFHVNGSQAFGFDEDVIYGRIDDAPDYLVKRISQISDSSQLMFLSQEIAEKFYRLMFRIRKLGTTFFYRNHFDSMKFKIVNVTNGVDPDSGKAELSNGIDFYPVIGRLPFTHSDVDENRIPDQFLFSFMDKHRQENVAVSYRYDVTLGAVKDCSGKKELLFTTEDSLIRARSNEKLLLIDPRKYLRLTADANDAAVIIFASDSPLDIGNLEDQKLITAYIQTSEPCLHKMMSLLGDDLQVVIFKEDNDADNTTTSEE